MTDTHPSRPKARASAFLAAALCLLAALPLWPQSPAVRIDGQADEWSPSALSRDARSGAEYAFRNDGRYLYVLFIVRDAKARASLDSTGLVLLAAAAPGKPERGVLFLKRAVPAEALIRWRESQGEALAEAEKARLRDMARHDLCLTFAVGAGGSAHGPLGRIDPENEPPSFASAEGPEGAVYELKVPLAPPDAVPGGLGLPPGGAVRVAFEWGGASRRALGAKAVRNTPRAERGGLDGVATPAQEFLLQFDPLSRPKTGTKKYSFRADVTLVAGR